jgi:hypothetical protein
VMRASMDLVWHAGQSGRRVIMVPRLGLGGSVTGLSVTGDTDKGAVIDHYALPNSESVVNVAQLSKFNEV